MASGSNKQFTQEEIERITSLPKRLGTVGETIREGYYDSVEKSFYPIDEDGNLVGKVGKVKKRTPPPLPPQEPDEPDEAQDSADDEDGNDEGGGKKISKAGKILIIVGAALVGVLLALYLLTHTGVTPEKPATPEATPKIAEVGEATPEPREPEVTPEIEAENMIEVVQAKTNVHKGEQISEEIVEKIAITPEEFNQLILTGITPAKWEDLDTIMDMYSNRFIPQGQYVAVTYISTSSPIPSNPWANPDGRYATLSIASSSLVEGDVAYYGAKGTLTLVRETEVVEETEEVLPEEEPVEESAEDGEVEYDDEGNPIEPQTEDEHVVIEGITYETAVAQSLIVDNYVVEDVVICDILNEDGESIYDYVSMYFDMPELNRRSEFLERCKDAEYLRKVTPVELVVRMNADQAEVIGSFDNLRASYDIDSNAADGDAQTIIVNATRLTAEMVDGLVSGSISSSNKLTDVIASSAQENIDGAAETEDEAIAVMGEESESEEAEPETDNVMPEEDNG